MSRQHDKVRRATAKPNSFIKWLSGRVSSKLEEGNFKGAVRLACSEDTLADHSEATLNALRLKHPSPHPDSHIVHHDSINPLPFPLDIETIMKAIVSFPNSSGGGFDGFLPQHLKDLSSQSTGEGGQLLRGALVGLATFILEGRTPAAIRPYFFGANLIALRKKGGGVRPIAVGCTLRRLASKCASLHALKTISHLLAPHQLGFGIPRGVEATVHATRIYLNNLSPYQALLKVDFRNAFNSIRRDKMLTAVRDFIPELLPYVHSAYSSPSI